MRQNVTRVTNGKHEKAVILLSGGMDSATLLHECHGLGYNCFSIGFDYGQRHLKELAAANRVAEHLEVPFQVISLAAVHDAVLFTANSSQTNPDIPVPHGHYAAESMKLTVVPNRNMMMLSVAAAYAITIGASTVGYAAHTGDHAVYPDCRPEFIQAMYAALRLCHFGDGIKLYTPYDMMSKADIAANGKELGVPYELTWSCYEGGKKHCGLCGTCVERKEAFELSKVPDPTEYAT